MDNPLIIREVALRADDNVLELLSTIPDIWSLLQPELASQFFWYQRTAEAFDLPDYLSWSKGSSENWHQIYNILVATRTGNPFDSDDEEPTPLDMNEWNLVAVNLLLERGYKIDTTRMADAAEYGSLEVVERLLEHKKTEGEKIDSGMLSLLMEGAILGDRVDTLQFLLAQLRSSEVLHQDRYSALLDVFKFSVYSSHVAAAGLIIEEMESAGRSILEMSFNSNHALVTVAIQSSTPEMIQFLIDKSLIDVNDLDWIELSIEKNRPELFSLLLAGQSLSNYLRKPDLIKIGLYVDRRTKVPIPYASELSGLSRQDVSRMLTSQTGNNFNKYHFEMLLREVAFVQADLGYYISWLTRVIKQQRVDRTVSELFLSALDSISTPNVVHTSDYFTAYSAFFLLANSKYRDVAAVLKTIESEEGVTREGLLKARVLLGLFDGRPVYGK
ncbi:Hypothetical protein POVR2_LOCUS333 [uncultured virus]|nr:Hypothetical protein POVR2_LOCUS333 [uncultured virus]